jgi:hypothetical protein
MRIHRPLAAGLALAAIVPLAGAADAAAPAAGSATSTLTLLSLSAVGKNVQAVTVTASSATTAGTLAKITAAPLKVDGADVVPAVTVEPSSSPVTVPSVSTPGALAAIASASTPSLQLSASDGAAGPASGLSTPDGLGSLSVLGLPIAIDGSVSIGSAVTGAKADAGKSVTISDLALPSLADLLASLGLDLSKLPAETLNRLLEDLPMTISEAVGNGVDTVNGAIDEAQAAVDDANDAVQDATQALSGAQQALATATTATQTAQNAFDAALDSLELTREMWDALAPELQHATSAWDEWQALGAAEATQGTASAAVTTAQGAIDDAQDLLAEAVDTLLGRIGDLADIVGAVLDGAPLVSLGEATIGTLARVDTGKTAQVVGSVSGLEVLGADVIDLATGSSTLDLAKTVSEVVGEINGQAQDVLDTLSDILTDAAGIVFPAPQVSVLTKSTSTGAADGFGTADVSVSALEISIPAVTLPSSVVLDSVLDALPVNIRAIGEGLLSATGFDLSVGTLTEAARYRPATLAGPKPAPTAPRPTLPATGAPIGLAVLGALAAAGAVMVRRRATGSAA